MKKKIIALALAAAAGLTARNGVEKSVIFSDNSGNEHEIALTINSDYISIEHYIDMDRNDGFFAGIVQHNIDGYHWRTWNLELFHDVDEAFLLLEIGAF